MPKIDLYYEPSVPTCRSVLLTGKALGLQFNLIESTLIEVDKEIGARFNAINPKRWLPTIVDNGFVLWESHTICIYLAEKYDTGRTLYPSDVKTKAEINRILFYNIGYLFRNYSFSGIFVDKPRGVLTPKIIHKMKQDLELLNDAFLEGKKFVTGDRLSIADYCLVATIVTVQATEFDFSKYGNVIKWIDDCSKAMPGYAQIMV